MKPRPKIYRRLFQVEITPARILVLGYLIAILSGSILLWLPFSSPRENPCSYMDALFTASSAVCVTGLIVRDTPRDFTPAGQAVILALIQIGGLGYMSIATVLSLLVGRRISLKERLMIREAYNVLTLEGLASFALRILKVTAVLELAGAAVLTLHWQRQGLTLLRAAALGVFHSVSAFCNAGFSLFSNNLSGFVADPVVNLTVCTLVISGGLGFIVISDLYKTRIQKSERRLTVHTKMVLMITGLLILSGTLFIYFLERHHTLRGLPENAKWLAALFQSVTPRTAGFNTVDIGRMCFPTLMLMMIFMFIGASPGGTGGGIKTTAFGVIMASVWATLSGRSKVNFLKSRISTESINRSYVLAFMAAMLVVLVALLLLRAEMRTLTADRMLPVLFEVVSAFGTVGLSTGSAIDPACSLAHDFNHWGKLLIILTMFAGRVGPMTLGTAVVWRRRDQPFDYPEGRVLIG
jgi:trk system potassium uptake protein TrkH